MEEWKNKKHTLKIDLIISYNTHLKRQMTYTQSNLT